MDKNAIKKYAVWARRELIEKVSQKALRYGIEKDKEADPNADSINGYLLTDVEKKQRQSLIKRVQNLGYDQVIEEVAYTWFNRFAALRFMEVNNYLPSNIRVFSDEAGKFKPQILSEAINLDIEGLNQSRIFELKEHNKDEELFKYLIVTQCNALSAILPHMFQKIEDYTELLLPDYLLREGSVSQQMVELIPEDDWKDQVQIIGWLYQYYNSEPKDKVFADLKKNIKITKENIPAATQLFTPDWIVRYMVENSLGRLWLEGHPNDNFKSDLRYYLDEAEQEPEVQSQLAIIRKEYTSLKPEDIRCIDPCMGSGHILCYLFDVLVKIYESYGYSTREAAGNIVKKNLWGLDIDDRASQLAYFAVMMKARQYDSRFFKRHLQPHVYAVEESNSIANVSVEKMGTDLSNEERVKAISQICRLIAEMHDAKEYGSIIDVTPWDWDLLRRFAVIKDENNQMSLDVHGDIENAAKLQKLIDVGEALAQKYHTVVTNPPYVERGKMSSKLSSYCKKYYSDSKGDLCTVFIERCKKFITNNGYCGMITQQSWMFLVTFENLRKKISKNCMINMLHLGTRAFEEIGGEVVNTTTFAFSSKHVADYKSTYVRLTNFKKQDEKEKAFLVGEGHFVAKKENFSKIPGAPIAYWLSERIFDLYQEAKTMDYYAHPKVGMQTSNNKKYLRYWFEVNYNEFNGNSYNLKWIKYLKGGEYRKWYGNLEYLLWYNRNPQFILRQKNARVLELFFLKKTKCTWTDLTSGIPSFRYAPDDSFYDISGHCFFPNKDNQYWLLAYTNSKIVCELKKIFNSTLHFQVGDLAKIIVPNLSDKEKNLISNISKENVSLSKADWDSFETSWDFQRHPLVNFSQSTIEEAFDVWARECEDRFNRLKQNEEELNRIFIEIYGLQDELSPEVEDQYVSVRKADLVRDIKSFISYAVGCMFGRYSLGVPGLAYAGGDWDTSKYKTFAADKENVIPICDDEYFQDDIVSQFVKFVETIYGHQTLEQNLRFIADTLGGNGTSRNIIRNYFMNEFYKDHVKVYQKRPIYWLFDAGKKNSFKCLIYMHRYRPDTIARVRTDYVHERQSRYDAKIKELDERINKADTFGKVKLMKQLNKLKEQADEIYAYEAKIHHLADRMIEINLDDGVKHNYEIFKDVVAKIK